VILGKVRLGFSFAVFFFRAIVAVVVHFGLEISGHGCTFAQPPVGLMEAGLSCSMEGERLDEGTSRVKPAITDTRDAVQLPLQRFEIRSSSRVVCLIDVELT
jgi:hypothetical protein